MSATIRLAFRSGPDGTTAFAIRTSNRATGAEFGGRCVQTPHTDEHGGTSGEWDVELTPNDLANIARVVAEDLDRIANDSSDPRYTGERPVVTVPRVAEEEGQ